MFRRKAHQGPIILKSVATLRDDARSIAGTLIVRHQWLLFRPKRKISCPLRLHPMKVWVPEIRGIMVQRIARSRGKVIVIGDAGLYSWELETYALACEVRRSIIAACTTPTTE